MVLGSVFVWILHWYYRIEEVLTVSVDDHVSSSLAHHTAIYLRYGSFDRVQFRIQFDHTFVYCRQFVLPHTGTSHYISLPTPCFFFYNAIGK